MNIILTNGVTLTPLTITGAKRLVQGEHRDVITFTFDGDASLDELDALFTAENCETIKITETVINEVGQEVTSEYIHRNYVLRDQLKSELVLVAPATDGVPDIYEKKVSVSMAQRTYAEAQLASLTDTLDILVMESLFTGDEVIEEEITKETTEEVTGTTTPTEETPTSPDESQGEVTQEEEEENV